MLRYGMFAVAILSSAMVFATAQTTGPVASGPKVGEDVPGPFHPLNVTGGQKGKKACLYCANGANQVAGVVASEATTAVATVLTHVDEATVKNEKANMGSYAVFCNDKDGLDKALTKLADDQKLSRLVLSIDNPAGPKDYKIAKDADVTVLLYNDFTVRA